jgi:tetratricopeptide (TPR) repeat protein
LYGPPGIGKSYLVQALLQDPDIQDEFKDGILWAGLGAKPELDIHQARWAHQLGIRLPSVRTRWLQTLNRGIGGRRILIVVDDAWEIQDALMLKLGGQRCAYLLTTHRRDVALEFAGEGIVHLAGLGTEAGLQLLNPAADDRAPATGMVDAVEGAPLAIRLLGGMLQKKSDTGQDQAAEGLLDQLLDALLELQGTPSQPNLNAAPALPTGVPSTIFASLRLAVDALSPQARKILNELSIFSPDPNTFTRRQALAIISGQDSELDELIRVGLVDQRDSGRLSLHQIVDDYASKDGRRLETARSLVDHMLIEFSDGPVAITHLQREFVNLMTALAFAIELEFSDAMLIAGPRFAPQFDAIGKYELAEYLLQKARQVALLEDAFAELAVILQQLAANAVRSGAYSEAQTYAREALTLSELEGLPALRPEILLTLAEANLYGVELDAASAAAAEAMALFKADGQTDGEVRALFALSRAETSQETPEAARDYLISTMTLARELDSPDYERQALDQLGELAIGRGNYLEAATWYRRALMLSRTEGNRLDEVRFLESLGRAQLMGEDYRPACVHLRQALAIYQDYGDEIGEEICIEHLSRATLELGDYSSALAHVRRRLSYAQERQDSYEEVEALQQFGRLFLELGRHDRAKDYFEQALEIHNENAFRAGEAHCNYYLAQLAFERQDYEDALKTSSHAIDLFVETGERRAQVGGLILAGRILAALERSDLAEDAFRQAERMCAEYDLPLASIQVQAGLVALAEDPDAASQDFSKQTLVLHHRDPETAANLPIWVILVAWDGLGDSKAEHRRALIASVWERLQEKSTWISNAVFERSFWENVADHQRIAAIWQAVEADV